MSLRSWAGFIRAKLQQGLYAGEGTVHFLPLCIMMAALEMSQAPWSYSNSDLVPLWLCHPWRCEGMEGKKVSNKVTVPHMTPSGLTENTCMGLPFLMLFLNLLLFYQDI